MRQPDAAATDIRDAAPAITSSSASVSAAVTRRIRGRADTPVRRDSRTDLIGIFAR